MLTELFREFALQERLHENLEALKVNFLKVKKGIEYRYVGCHSGYERFDINIDDMFSDHFLNVAEVMLQISASVAWPVGGEDLF